MNEVCRNVAAEKIKEMPVERVMKLRIGQEKGGEASYGEIAASSR